MRLVILALLVLPAFAGDGWSKLELGGQTVEVYRDVYGIPHVFAKTVEAAFRAEGYLEAEDRMWQLETYRRSARGQLAELLGEKELRSDQDRRRDGYTDAELQKLFDSSSERMRRIVTAYTAGVNDFLKAGKLPPQYADAKHEPRAWHETDSLAIGVMMARRFGEAGDAELQVQQLYTTIEKKMGADKALSILRDVLRDSDPRAPSTLHDHERGPAKSEKGSFAPPPVRGDFADVLREREELAAHRESLGIPTYAGSNAWVVAPKKSASGRAILYGGPMMGFRTPSICNEIHLVAPGLNVAGMSFPGTPGVMIGFNEHVAFTTTSGGADLVDVFELEFNDAGEYKHGGAWHKLKTFDVEIKVAGQDARKQTIRRSLYGPLLGEPKNGKAYAKCMSFWMKEQLTFDAVMDFNFATSVAEFAKAVPKVVTSHNWFAADRDGHIGFWFAGAHPQRKKAHDPRFPQKGDGSMDWDGLVPFEKWPQAIDPPHGFFGNWNNKPARAWEPMPFGKIFWGKKILDTLDGTDKLTFEQCERLAYDTAYHDFVADYFRPHILAAAKDDKDENVAKAVDLLTKYDLVKRDGRPEPVIVEKWMQAMMTRVFGDEFGLAITQKSLQRFLGDPLLYVLEGNGALKYDFAAGVDLKAAALESLRDVVKDGCEKLGWKEESVDFKGKIGKARSTRGRGTYQMTVEMGSEGPRATTLAAPGQSEREDSPHYADQFKLYEPWKYKAFVFRREEMK